MVYRYQSMYNFCCEDEKYRNILDKLYNLAEDQWGDTKNLRNECGVSVGEWKSFINRAGTKYGAGFVEIKHDYRKKSHQTKVRISPESREVVKKIIDKLHCEAD